MTLEELKAKKANAPAKDESNLNSVIETVKFENGKAVITVKVGSPTESKIRIGKDGKETGGKSYLIINALSKGVNIAGIENATIQIVARVSK
jgi:hypothetical protein